jgi:DNA-binding GntR family transcriptional regulator
MSIGLPLARSNLSDSAASALRLMIVDGRLPAGERINEVQLSQELGVSRTPLREALARLVTEGTLRAVPRLGYFVRPLSLEEFEQVYAIRPILDPAALRLAGVPDAERLARLGELNRKLAAARDAEAAIALDDGWHLELLAHCPTRVLLELIENMMMRTRRYEIALMREAPGVVRASADHRRILAALRRNDLGGACAALKHNLKSGRAPIVEWLRRRRPVPVMEDA